MANHAEAEEGRGDEFEPSLSEATISNSRSRSPVSNSLFIKASALSEFFDFIACLVWSIFDVLWFRLFGLVHLSLSAWVIFDLIACLVWFASIVE